MDGSELNGMGFAMLSASEREEVKTEPLRLLILTPEQEAEADRKMAEFEAWERRLYNITREEQLEALHSSMRRGTDPMDRYEDQPSRVTP